MVTTNYNYYSCTITLANRLLAPACDYINGRNELQCPVYGILCDGLAFELFKFDSTRTPQITIGMSRFSLANPHTASTPEFFRTVRVLCEMFFHILLLGYEHRLESMNANANATDVVGQACQELKMGMCYASLARMEALSATRLDEEGDLEGAEEHAQMAAMNLQDRFVK